MRKIVLAMAMLAGLASPALAQGEEHWTYLSLSDGTVAWDDKDVFRHPDGRVSVKVMQYRNDPGVVPDGATHTAKSSGPGQTFDMENYFAAYSCSSDLMSYEGGVYFALRGDQVHAVADAPEKPAAKAASKLDNAIREHVCRGVKPAGSGEAASTGAMINVAVALEKRTRSLQ